VGWQAPRLHDGAHCSVTHCIEILEAEVMGPALYAVDDREGGAFQFIVKAARAAGRGPDRRGLRRSG
jgi:hypothetical protein